MAKYKVCPSCKHLNPPNALDCENEKCGADLSTVRVTDEVTVDFGPDKLADFTREFPLPARPVFEPLVSGGEPSRPARPVFEPLASARESSWPAPQGQAVRICDFCQTPNPPNGRKCVKCGGDISDIMPIAGSVPIPAPGLETPKELALASLDGRIVFTVPEGETILGREAEMSAYLGTKVYVSRRHAKLILRDGRLTVENLNATNSTFVNNQRIDQGAAALKEGDEIGLGGNMIGGQRQEYAAYFRVRAL